jgi:hypothetical protein
MLQPEMLSTVLSPVAMSSPRLFRKGGESAQKPVSSSNTEPRTQLDNSRSALQQNQTPSYVVKSSRCTSCGGPVQDGPGHDQYSSNGGKSFNLTAEKIKLILASETRQEGDS